MLNDNAKIIKFKVLLLYVICHKFSVCRLRRNRAASWRGNVGFLPRSQGVVMQTKIALIIRKIEVKRKQFPLAGYKHGQTRNRESLCAENGR